MSAPKVMLGAALLASLREVAGFRARRSSASAEAKSMGGVPIHNYQDRFIQKEVATSVGIQNAQDVFDWVLMLKTSQSEHKMQDFCGGEVGCNFIGHKGGVPFATLRSTEKELEHFLGRHVGQVEFAEPEFPVEVPELPDMPGMAEPEDSVSASLWNHRAINLADAKFTGKGVHIYVMDTGVRVSHNDFEGRAIPTIDTVANAGVVTECEAGDTRCAKDDNGHGTHCAGTAGGKAYGVAKEATIHAMKVCCGSGSNVYGGMDYIAVKAIKPAVMTMSLGSYSKPESARVASDAVVNSGVTVVVSAGNRGVDSCTKSYTFITSVLGVGSTDSGSRRSSFSNYGACNDIYAPGSSIKSASHQFNWMSSTKSGTSMAAPHVAGATALLLEEEPSLTPDEVKSTLRARATAGVLTDLKEGDPNLLLNVGA